ncbi:MAG: hypothetical protein Q8T08_26160, partial [Ignavibacteria bacterium]|nr:hypothetical protein [Ignavibacteria bacterium]
NYSEEVKPNGKMAIDEIVKNVSKISDKREKLNQIAEWELSGFESYHWGNYSGCVSSSSVFLHVYDALCPIYDKAFIYCCPFTSTKNGNIRVATMFPSSWNPYYDNPYWIAHYKNGACGELATLFNYTASQSGFITQIVTSESHNWVEIKMENNEWWYFDPLCYKVIYNEDKRNETKWFNQTQYYRQNCYNEIMPIRIKDSLDYVDFRYPRPQ